MNKDFIFICGCPRSGTTALWNYLSTTEQCVIGVERYGNRFFSDTFIGPEHFEKERFFSMKEGDTFYDNLEEFNPYYKIARSRYDSALLIGDKIPLLYRYFHRVKESFPSAKIVMIFRNPFDVAASYKARAKNPNDVSWHADKGVKSAITDWAQSLQSFREWHSALNITPVDYETLFVEGKGAQRLLHKIGVENTPQLEEKFSRLITRSNQLERDRPRDLSAQEVKYISTTAPFGIYREILPYSMKTLLD